MFKKIRKAEAADVTYLVDFMRNTIRAHYRPILGKEGVEAYIDRVASDVYLLDQLEDAQVLLLSEAIVGFAIYRGDRIELIMIADGFHRQGLGSHLLGFCERKLFKKHPAIHLGSFEGNQKAIQFFKKKGWQETEMHRDEDSGVNMIYFVKKAE